MANLAITISFTAMSLLCLEVIWMRLFSIESFSSFGYMILSIALLGFGVGGVLISLFSERFGQNRQKWLYLFALAYPIALVVSMVLSKQIPFVPQSVIQDRVQLVYIGLYYLLLALPFVAASLTIGLILTTAGKQVGKLYFADLVGSGLGGVLVLVAFYLVHPEHLSLVVLLLFLPALVAATWGWAGKGRMLRVAISLLVLLVSTGFLLRFGALNVSEYKGISYALSSAEVTGARVVEESWGPLGYLQVVESASERTAPALSTGAPIEAMPPVQPGLYIDGSKVASVARSLSPEDAAYQDWLLTSVAYRLKAGRASVADLEDEEGSGSELAVPSSAKGAKGPRVFIVGLGGGEEVAQALHVGASHVTVAEVNSVLLELIANRFETLNGGLLKRPDVEVLIADGRDAARKGAGQFDLVVLTFMDASGLSLAGARSLTENYLYTVEAMKSFLGALDDGGILAMAGRLTDPPRGCLRTVTTAIEAARQLYGVEAIRHSFAYVGRHGDFFGMLLFKKGGFAQSEIDLLLEDTSQHHFNVSFYPGMTQETRAISAAQDEAFWAHLKETEGVDLGAFDEGVQAGPRQDPYFDALSAMLYDSDGGLSYIEAYPFDISPTEDDRPYFSAMLKSGSLDYIEKNAYDPAHWEREVPPDLWAQPVVLVTLIQALFFGALILLIPVLVARKRIARGGKLRAFIYFSCLGIGYMFVEMVLIQKFTLYVSAPAYAAAVVLSGMLVFSGLGSYVTTLFKVPPKRMIIWAIAGTVAFILIYNIALIPILHATISWSEWLKVVVAILSVGPVAFFMGMPFPLALTSLSDAPALSAWGWAVNGALSVSGIVAAQTLAMYLGFSAVFWLVAGVYLLALATFPVLDSDGSRQGANIR